MLSVLQPSSMATHRKEEHAGETATGLTGTLTLRLSQEDRSLLDRLVEQRAAELIDDGIEVTAASYVRGLIRREARARGLLDAVARLPDPATAGLAPSAVEPVTTATGQEPAVPREPLSVSGLRAALKEVVESGVSQAEIARRAQIHTGQLSQFKQGKTALSADTRRRLYAALKTR